MTNFGSVWTSSLGIQNQSGPVRASRKQSPISARVPPSRLLQQSICVSTQLVYIRLHTVRGSLLQSETVCSSRGSWPVVAYQMWRTRIGSVYVHLKRVTTPCGAVGSSHCSFSTMAVMFRHDILAKIETYGMQPSEWTLFTVIGEIQTCYL